MEVARCIANSWLRTNHSYSYGFNSAAPSELWRKVWFTPWTLESAHGLDPPNNRTGRTQERLPSMRAKANQSQSESRRQHQRTQQSNERQRACCRRQFRWSGGFRLGRLGGRDRSGWCRSLLKQNGAFRWRRRRWRRHLSCDFPRFCDYGFRSLGDSRG